MAALLGPDGQPVDNQGKPLPLPGLDLRRPVETLDLLGVVAKSGYTQAQVFASQAGIKGERHVKVLCRDVSGLASQMAVVSEFAANALSELTFTLAESEARIKSLMELVPKERADDAAKSEHDVSVDFENRRRYYSARVPLLVRQKKRIGPALAEAIAGPVPTEADFNKMRDEAIELGMVKKEDVEKAEKALADHKEAVKKYQELVAGGMSDEEARAQVWPTPPPQADAPEGAPAQESGPVFVEPESEAPAEIKTLEDDGMAGGPPQPENFVPFPAPAN
jgi:hypothetical protein